MFKHQSTSLLSRIRAMNTAYPMQNQVTEEICQAVKDMDKEMERKARERKGCQVENIKPYILSDVCLVNHDHSIPSSPLILAFPSSLVLATKVSSMCIIGETTERSRTRTGGYIYCDQCLGPDSSTPRKNSAIISRVRFYLRRRSKAPDSSDDKVIFSLINVP